MASGGSVINEQNTINEQDDFGHSSDGHSSEGSEVFDTQGGNEYGNSYNNDHENSELEDEYSTNRDESDHGELNSFTERSIVNTVKNSGKRKGVEVRFVFCSLFPCNTDQDIFPSILPL